MAHLDLDLRAGYSPILRYGFSVGCVAIALALALIVLFYGFRDVGLPLFVMAIALVTWHVGGGPSVAGGRTVNVVFRLFLHRASLFLLRF